MACGGKITKGGGMVVAIPFDATDVENLVVSVYTNGDEKIEKSGDDIRIGDGIIYVDMSKTDVDLLADGVVSYTMDYEIDGVQYSESGGTTNYIKTPKDYSATSITEVVQSAYTEGHEVGYQEGYDAGQQDCPECSGGTSCNLQAKSQSIDGSGTGLWNIYPDAGYDGMESVTILDDGYGQAKYEEGHYVGKNEGYESGHYDGMIEGFESGYTAGQADCPECSGGSCTLQNNYEVYLNGTETAGQFPIAPDAGYDGVANGTIYYAEAYQAKYAEGYAAGQASCPECDCSSAITEAFQSGYTAGQADCPECSGGSSCNLENGEILIFDTFENGDVFYPSNGYDGFSSVTIYDKNYSETWFNSGYTEGYYAAWLYYPSDVFCRLDTGVNIGGTYSVDLHRNNDTHIVNPNYRNEFIILGNYSDSDNCYMQLSLTDDNIIRLILDDTETTSVLSAQTYGEYIHADIIFNESESSVTLNVINHGYNGSMAISLSASGFDWIMQDMAQELVINGEYNDGESEHHPELYPPYTSVATCNIMIDKIVAYDNYGNMEHLWKYKKGCLADCMTNNQYSFLRCVYHSDLRYWSQDPVEIKGTPLGMGGV